MKSFPGRLALVCSLGLTSAAPAPAAAGDEEFAAVQEAFAKRDHIALSRLHDKDYKKLILPLTQEQLNKVALLAGENLEIDSVLKGVKYTKFFDLLLPGGNAKVHERWCINGVSMYLLRRLSDERRITDSAVLPHLIGALKHPDTSFRCQASICLQELTFREVGYVTFARGIDDAKIVAPLQQWWQDWWQKNKGKQLIIDVAFDKKLAQRALDTTNKIFASLAAKYPDDLMKLHMPKELDSQGQQLPYVSYEPRWMAYTQGTGPKNKKINELPMLWVGAQFLTPGEDTAKKKPWLAPVGVPFKVIYEEALPNTDVAFRVLLDTPDPKLAQDMIQLFKKDKNK
jgi:hypothetical protein